MKNFKSIVLVLLASVFTVQAEEVPQVVEQSFDLIWVAPTMRENGIPLTEDEILRYNVYWSPDAVEYTLIGGTTEVFFTAVHSLPVGPEAHTYLYVVTTIDTNGQESKYSNIQLETFIVMSDSPPSPPGELSIYERRCTGCIIESVTTIDGMGVSSN